MNLVSSKTNKWFLFLYYVLITLGKQIEIDDVVVGLEEMIGIARQDRRRFGTAGAFPILFREAWKEDFHVFAAEGGKLPLDTATQRLGPPERVATNVLNRHPVQVLAVEETSKASPGPQSRFWVKWLDICKQANLPDYILISAHARELVEADGLHTKPWRRRFQGWGYEAHYWFLRAHDHGGVVSPDRSCFLLHASCTYGGLVNPYRVGRSKKKFKDAD